jgi:two-component system nitrogen regulation response regulator NtrX
MSLDILVVDDEQDIRELVAGVLEDEGYETRAAGDSDAALEAISARRPSLVLLDVWLQGSRLDGLDLLDEIKRRDPSIPVLVISGHGNIDTAVAAIRRGAVDFIEKPFNADRLLLMVARATETERLRQEVASLRASIGRDTDLTGNSGAINGVRATLKRVAGTGSRVLVMGAAGVGKEVAARLLHNWSQRAQGPFIIVSAARMTPERVEEELFGVEEAGDLVRTGLLEQAHGGTLFLDEIADMPIATQGRILRVLTDQSFTRVNGQRTVKVDVRVVSATARDLTTEIAEGRFREDLYYRLNVVPVAIPPLTDRREDIPALVEHFVAHYANERRVPTPEVADDAMVALQSYEWPGNVRQLRNVVERTIILAPGDRIGRIDVDLLPAEVLGGNGDGAGASAMMGAPLREARETFEREYLRVQIRRFSGNISRTATFIGMERSALDVMAPSPYIAGASAERARVFDAGERRLAGYIPPRPRTHNGRQANFASGPLPQRAAQDQDAGDDVPRQGRQAAGHRYLVRQFQRAVAPRRAIAADLQARHFDDHAVQPDRRRRNRRCGGGGAEEGAAAPGNLPERRAQVRGQRDDVSRQWRHAAGTHCVVRSVLHVAGT